MIEAFGLQWGTLFQLLTTVFSGGIFAAILTFIVSNRRISVDAAGQLRKHFSEELDRMAQRMNEAEDRQRSCEGREEQLRCRVRKLEDDLEGVYRTLVASSAEKVIELGDAVPEHIRDMAQRTLDSQRRDR